MATDSHGMGIPLPADSTKIHQFPAVARSGFEKVAEVLAGGMTEGMERVAGTVLEAAMDAADVITGDDPRVPAIVGDSEYLSLTTDTAGRITEAVRTNGRKYLPQADIDEAAVGTLAVEKLTQAGQTITREPVSEYSRVTVDASGRIAEDALDASGRTPGWVLKAWAERMGTVTTGAQGITPELMLAAFGDSMTDGYGGAGTNWPAVAARVLGLPVYKAGFTGQTSSEIAMRQGGLEVRVTVAGHRIPASGAVVVDKITPDALVWAGSARTFPGTVAGIPGTLAKSAADVWTFTRATAGTAAACPPSTRFISDLAEPYNNWINVFWTGRNNPGREAVERDTAAMVRSLRPAKPRYLVLGICNKNEEPSGSAGHAAIVAINKSLAALYGDQFFDVRRYLIDYGLYLAGITPTTADKTATAEDRIAPSLMSDNIHLNAAGYTVVGEKIAALIIEKGWNK